jgi:hypothetical protein
MREAWNISLPLREISWQPRGLRWVSRELSLVQAETVVDPGLHTCRPNDRFRLEFV